MYYDAHRLFEFEAEVVDVFANVRQQMTKNILILNQSAVYPTSGGQIHDKGWITIEGEEFSIENVEKVGKVVLHILNKEVPEGVIGKKVHVRIDKERRI
jgi:alanyl-tRNA synthetase